MATLETINARIAKLQAQAESLVVKKSTAVLDKIRELMNKHGVSVADIEAHAGKHRGRKPGKTSASTVGSAAKYRDPKTGATWTGHGRAPQWIASAKDRNKFLVGGASSNTAAAEKKTAKAGNYPRGPQPAMYQDPKTGATWSGRGRAPAWLASVKDRTKFLIADSSGVSAEPKAKASKKTAPAKKAVTKAAAKKASATKVQPAAKKAAVKATAKAAAPKEAAVKKSATKKTPAKKTPAKKTPAKRAPVKKARVKAAADEAAVGGRVPVEVPVQTSEAAMSAPSA